MDSKVRKYTQFKPAKRLHTNHAEPDQSLSIDEILRNVATTGVTGLPRPITAVYDDDDNDDFGDESIQPEFDNLDALDALESHRRNARSIQKRIDAERKHRMTLRLEKQRKDAAELEALRKEHAAKVTKSEANQE